MPVLWIDGFDHYSSSADLGRNNYSAVIASGIDTTTPRTGTSALNSAGIIRNFASQTRAVIGIAIYPTLNTRYHGTITLGSGFTDPNAALGSGGTNNVGIQLAMDNNGGMILSQGAASGWTTLFASASGLIPLNAYSFMELIVDNSLGRAEAWLNGNQNIFNVTGITGLVGMTQGAWGQPNILNGVYFDDIYVTNDVRLGAHRCYSLYVNADQLPQDWVKSSGVNAYALLNSQNYVTTNYIQGNAVGNKSQFGCQPLPMSNAIVNAIRLSSVQELDAAGSGGTVQHAFIGAATYNGASFGPLATPSYSNDMFTLGGSTTVAQINTMSIQMERTI